MESQQTSSGLNKRQQNSQFMSRKSHKSALLERNDNMNKSAILTDKLALRISKQIPLYISTKTQKQNSSNRPSNRSQVSSNMLVQIAGSSVASSNLRGSKKDIFTDKIKQQKGNQAAKKRFPREIIDILYRQGLKNYNPYLNALNTLQKYEEQDLSYIQKEQIKNLCFLGIAKKFLRNKKYAQTPQYSRTGVLIRTYMNDIITEKLEKKRDEEQIIIVQSNPTALSFNPNNRPQQLQECLTKKKYSEVIKSVNSIISSEYRKYKLRNCSFLNNSLTYSEITMYILVSIIIFILVVLNPQRSSDVQTIGIVLVIGLIFIGMALSWIECSKNVNQVHESTSMIDTTCKKIQKYFQSINNDTLIWKVGQDFYWIQIHNIKVHKRKYHYNSDDF